MLFIFWKSIDKSIFLDYISNIIKKGGEGMNNIDLDKEKILLEKFRQLDSVEQINVINHMDFAILTARSIRRQYELSPENNYPVRKQPVA
jgi:hypothetical protein